MSEDEKQGGAGLFKPAGESGGFFKAKAGDMFIGVFQGTSSAGTSTFEGKESEGIWWHFDLYKVGDPNKKVMWTPEDGPDKGKRVHARVDGRTSTSTGAKSKARSWFAALVQRTLSDADFADEEAITAIYEEALGARAVLSFGPSQNNADSIVLTSVLRYNEDDDDDDEEDDDEE